MVRPFPLPWCSSSPLWSSRSRFCTLSLLNGRCRIAAYLRRSLSGWSASGSKSSWGRRLPPLPFSACRSSSSQGKSSSSSWCSWGKVSWNPRACLLSPAAGWTPPTNWSITSLTLVCRNNEWSPTCCSCRWAAQGQSKGYLWASQAAWMASCWCETPSPCPSASLWSGIFLRVISNWFCKQDWESSWSAHSWTAPRPYWSPSMVRAACQARSKVTRKTTCETMEIYLHLVPHRVTNPYRNCDPLRWHRVMGAKSWGRKHNSESTHHRSAPAPKRCLFRARHQTQCSRNSR